MKTLLFNNDSKQDLDLLLDIAKKIGFDLKVAPDSSSKQPSLKEKKYLNNLKKAAKEMKEISSGKKEAQTLQSFLDEL